MGKEIGCCGQSVRIAFILINIFFVAIGFVLLALGIYLVIVGEDYEFVTRNEYASTAPILIVCGAVSAIVAILGVVGGIGLWWPVLMIYVVVVAMVVILEIIAGILGFVFQSDIADHYAQTLNATIYEYRDVNATDFQTDVNGFVDYVQNEFECCGIQSADIWLQTQYFMSVGQYPESCQCDDLTDNCIVLDSQMVYKKGCNESLFDFIQNNAAIIGGVGIAFGLIEIVGIVFAITLCCCVIRANKNDKDSWAL